MVNDIWRVLWVIVCERQDRLCKWKFLYCCVYVCIYMGTAVAQWLRCCATNRKVAGSIPAGISGFFIVIKSFRSHYSPGVDSASNINECQEHFLGGKGGRCVRLTTLPPSCAVVTKSGNLNFLEPSGPLQTCNRTDLPLYIYIYIYIYIYMENMCSATDSFHLLLRNEKCGRIFIFCKIQQKLNNPCTALPEVWASQTSCQSAHQGGKFWQPYTLAAFNPTQEIFLLLIFC